MIFSYNICCFVYFFDISIAVGFARNAHIEYERYHKDCMGIIYAIKADKER